MEKEVKVSDGTENIIENYQSVIGNNAVFFGYNQKESGGTEAMARYFHKNIAEYLPKLKNYNCIILPGSVPREDYSSLIYEDKEIILWLHNTTIQFGIGMYHLFTDKRFLDKLKYVIVVSEHQKNDFVNTTGIDPKKVVVIYNAIDPIANDISRFQNVDEIKVIYTSNPVRGLDVLLNALPYIDHNFKLSVFSDFNIDVLNFPDNAQKIIDDERILFYGKTPKKTVLDELSKSHIFAYPNIWEETFCLSQVEALSANCLTLYNNFGSLPEVSLGYGMSYNAPVDNLQKHVEIFIEHFNKAIEIIIKNKKFNPGLQSKAINEKFSFDNFEKSWLNFYEML